MGLARKLPVVLLLAATCHLDAQEHHHTQPSNTNQLGSVWFPISCPSSVQAPFERGIALLHSFGYNAAEAQFKRLADADPSCAMAYWGEAMSLYRQLWDRPSESDLGKGLALVQKAQSTGGKTERERGYIEAAAAFYTNDPKASYETRTAAYSQALAHLHAQFPADDEAAVFYALSLLASPGADQNDFAYRKQPVSILNAVFARRPDHPGVAHYLIHACDNPEMAHEALPAARRYAQIAPASAHALHMPSHIFARLGDWQDDIQSNLASVAAAGKQHAPADRLHAMDFLEYAYLQLGNIGQAKAIKSEATEVKQQDFSKDMQEYFFYVQMHFPALLALETKDWKGVYSLTIPASAAPDFQAGLDWAKAIAAAHLHDRAAAEEAVRNYDLALEAVRNSTYSYVANQMTTEHDEAHAWLAFVRGNTAEATQLLFAVADKQDRTGKGEVEIPAREMLADMLLESNRPQEALAQYQASLETDPNRFNSLCGAAHAAELARQPAKAKTYYEALLAGREGIHGPELSRARAYLN